MSERRWREAGRLHGGAGWSPGLPWGGRAESSRGAGGLPERLTEGLQQGGRRPRPAGRERGADRAPGAVLSVSQSPEGLKTRGPNHRAVLTAPGHSLPTPSPSCRDAQGNLSYRNHQGWHTGFCTLTATTTAERVTWLPAAGAPLLPSYLPP